MNNNTATTEKKETAVAVSDLLTTQQLETLTELKHFYSYKRSRFKEWFFIVSGGVLISGFLLLLVPIYWLMMPYAGITEYRVTAVSSPVMAGQLFEWEVKYCIDNPAGTPITVTRELILQNHVVSVPLGDTSYTSIQPCETFTRAALLPHGLHGGTYRVVTHTAIEVNPLRTVRQTFTSSEFTLIPAQIK